MDSIEKYKIKGRQREAKYKIRFTNTAIDNFKVKDKLDKGKFIKVRFKDQRGIWYNLSELLFFFKKRDFTCFYV